MLNEGASILTTTESSNTMKHLFEEKININKKSVIVDLNQSLQAVKPKPYFLDLAQGGVEYPDLTAKVGQKKAGWFGKLWG